MVFFFLLDTLHFHALCLQFTAREVEFPHQDLEFMRGGGFFLLLRMGEDANREEKPSPSHAIHYHEKRLHAIIGLTEIKVVERECIGTSCMYVCNG
jgi:hypothetical protein